MSSSSLHSLRGHCYPWIYPQVFPLLHTALLMAPWTSEGGNKQGPLSQSHISQSQQTQGSRSGGTMKH